MPPVVRVVVTWTLFIGLISYLHARVGQQMRRWLQTSVLQLATSSLDALH
jgi:hypothetical protein